MGVTLRKESFCRYFDHFHWNVILFFFFIPFLFKISRSRFPLTLGDNRSFSCSCRNVVFSLVLTAILLQLVHYSRTPEQGWDNFSWERFLLFINTIDHVPHQRKKKIFSAGFFSHELSRRLFRLVFRSFPTWNILDVSQTWNVVGSVYIFSCSPNMKCGRSLNP